MSKLVKTCGCVAFFVGVWIVATWTTLRETRVDVDLGIAPAELPLADAAVWSLPLALAVSLAVFVVGFLVARLGHTLSR